jgi:phospholipase/carboxylesterase
MSDDLGFIHAYEPGSGDSTRTTLLLLHGTGGNETDLVPLGRMIAPGATLISPRGKVLENGMPRFFRRLAEGVFDVEDLKFRTAELAEFIDAAANSYGLDREAIVAVGFSNGANIASSLLLSDPQMLSGAILFRAMVPFETDDLPDLSGKRVLISAGQTDPLIPQDQTEVLASMLDSASADVTLKWLPTGHGLTREDVEMAREWLRLPDSLRG